LKDIAAIILAGGKSTRMGQDKAFLAWRGKTFIQHLIDAVAPLTSDIYISGGGQKLNTLGYEVIADEINNEGPVVALASCFKRLAAENVLVLSCDVPQITAKDLEELIAAHKNNDATYFKFLGKSMPLAGIYNKSCFSVFIAEMQKGERKLFNVINKLNTKEVEYSGVRGLQNVNTPQDFKILT